MDFTSSSSPQTDKFNRTISHSREQNTSSKSTTATHGSALKLGAKKPTSKTDKSSKARHPSDEPPGNEFDVTRIPVLSSEPDYFADMEPSVSFKAKDSKTIPVHPHSEQLSSKLAMVEDTSQV